MIRTRVVMVTLASSVVLGGCASTSPEEGFRDMAQTVEQRTGHRLRWNQATPEDEDVGRAIRKLLHDELSLSSAVQIALLNNTTLLATYEELSLAQADVVQAGLLRNPVFSANIATAERDALDPNIIFGVTQDFLDVLMLPARKRIAASQFEAAKMRVADQVLALASDVRTAFLMLQGAEQVLAMRRLVAASARAAAELAGRQQEAGNLSDLSLAVEQGLYEQIKLDAARSEADVLSARERLTRLMGVWGLDTAWKIKPRLPDVPTVEVDFDHLEALAVAQRLDLDALLRETQALSHALSVVKSTRWTPGITAGVDVARLKSGGGTIVVGPKASVELPIFDQRQAMVARLRAELRASELRYTSKAIDVRSEVRLARDRVIFTRRVVEHYRTVLVPLRERIVALSQQEYDAMLLGVYQLLLAKQNEVSTYREYIEAARDYWLARSDLERAVGGRLVRPGSDAASAPAIKLPGDNVDPSATPAHQHHH